MKSNYEVEDIKLPSINSNTESINITSQTPNNGGFKQIRNLDGIHAVLVDNTVRYFNRN
jgi:hypothetical protein